MPERSPIRAGLRQEIPRRVYRNGRDADHEAITPFVTNADQKVIKRRPGDVISVSVAGCPRARRHLAEAPGPEPGTHHGPFGGNDLFVETHKAIDFRLSEHARGCPLRSKHAPVRRGTRWKDPKIQSPERAGLLPSPAVLASREPVAAGPARGPGGSGGGARGAARAGLGVLWSELARSCWRRRSRSWPRRARPPRPARAGAWPAAPARPGLRARTPAMGVRRPP